MTTVEKNALKLAQMLSELQEITATASTGIDAYDISIQLGTMETWGLTGDTPEDVREGARDLYNALFQTEEDLMYFTEPEEYGRAAMFSRIGEGIYDTVCAWVEQLD